MGAEFDIIDRYIPIWIDGQGDFLREGYGG